MRCFFFIPLFLVLFFPASLAASPLLFEDYAHGASRAELEKRPGMKRGEGAFAADLLLDEARFAKLPWNARFEFRNDALVRVSLMERYSPQRFQAVVRELSSGGYEMLAVLIDRRRLDLVALLKALGPETVRREVSERLKQGSHARVAYAWFQTASASADAKTGAAYLNQFLASIAAETREAEVTLLGDPQVPDAPPQLLLVDFTFPALLRP